MAQRESPGEQVGPVPWTDRIIPGSGRELPPGASATTARIRRSTSAAASAVQPPKL